MAKGAVSEEAVRGLGLVGYLILMAFYFVSIVFIVFYPITRERYEEIRNGLYHKNGFSVETK